MNKKYFLISVRLILGFTALLAITIQAISLHQAGVFNAVNYFSYFTNLSNVFAAIVLIISAFYLAKSRKPMQTDDIIRGASVLYMAVTGVVYALLLTDVEVSLQIPWVNILLHYIMPIAVVIDWLIRPPATRLTFKQTWLWLIFPLAYLLYSLIRGAVLNWYPYPFLNPAHTGGYLGVILYCFGVLATFVVLSWLLMKASNNLAKAK